MRGGLFAFCCGGSTLDWFRCGLRLVFLLVDVAQDVFAAEAWAVGFDIGGGQAVFAESAAGGGGDGDVGASWGCCDCFAVALRSVAGCDGGCALLRSLFAG